MPELTNVGVAELKVSTNSGVLASFGLGSCVAVAMFDPHKKLGGLAHVMLPQSRGKDSEKAPGKFADTAVSLLLEELLKVGARKNSIRCKIVGGAQMFDLPGAGRTNQRGGAVAAGSNLATNIGARNTEAVKGALDQLGIPLIGEDTGGNYGRTVKFNTSNGEVEVSSIYHGRTVL